MAASDCQDEKYDIKVLKVDNDGYMFFINNVNQIFREECGNANVLFKLMIEIEECYCKKLKQTEDNYAIFHGGLISIDGNGVMVIGEKGKGKSTLIALLSTDEEIFFCSDDIVAYKKNSFYGIPMPQRLRIQISKFMKNIFYITEDFQGNIRYLHYPQKYITEPSVSKLVIIQNIM